MEACCSAMVWRRVFSCSATLPVVSTSEKSSISYSARISISDSSSIGLGHCFTHSIASSMDLTFQIQNPATNSLVWVKGPLVTVRRLPLKRMRTPSLLGFRPSPNSISPAFTSFSLKSPIAVSRVSLGIFPASELEVALTITMTFIAALHVRKSFNKYLTTQELWLKKYSNLLLSGCGEREYFG